MGKKKKNTCVMISAAKVAGGVNWPATGIIVKATKTEPAVTESTWQTKKYVRTSSLNKTF
jgi:hypothetical protein